MKTLPPPPATAVAVDIQSISNYNFYASNCEISGRQGKQNKTKQEPSNWCLLNPQVFSYRGVAWIWHWVAYPSDKVSLLFETFYHHLTRLTRCSPRRQTSPPASAASLSSRSHAPMSAVNSHMAAPPICLSSRRRMHSSAVDGWPLRASSKLSASRLAATVCCLHAMAVRSTALF